MQEGKPFVPKPEEGRSLGTMSTSMNFVSMMCKKNCYNTTNLTPSICQMKALSLEASVFVIQAQDDVAVDVIWEDGRNGLWIADN